jgi:penicillin-binding protein 1A
MGLGSDAVSPLEMASAYATLAAGGIYSEPLAITKVVLPDGSVDRSAGWGKPKRERVIQDWVAHEVTQVLESNMTSGTATGAYFGRIAAGKTGTTEDHADGWLCGYTPQLATAVWVGYPDAERPVYVHGVAIAGGNIPASIWHDFMAPALASAPALDFPLPKTAARFVTWSKGSYGYLGSTGVTPTTTATTTATTRATTTKATTSHPATTQTPPPPPVTTTTAPPPPPPVTTTEPPPVTTSTAPPTVTP